MSSWRSYERRRTNPKQPTLPGLFGYLRAGDTIQTLRKFSSPGDFALIRARGRLAFVFLGFSLLFSVISGRLVLLTLQGEAQEPPVIHALAGNLPVTGRADIVDRNGTVLATSLPTVMLMVDTRKILDPKEAAKKISEVLPDINEENLASEFEHTKHYVTIRRHLTPRQYYAINKMGIAGLEFIPDESRIYPSGPVTSHVVGFTDIDNNGIAGLEKSQNDRLQNQQAPIITTLDIRLQTILHRELENVLKEYHALGAAGLIMDTRNGEILALVSLPDFNPQEAGIASDNAKFNRATLGVYEMGSTFKTFNTALALDSGIVKPWERFDTLHPIEIGGRIIRDFHPAKYWQNVAEIFIESSNIGSVRMVEKVGTEKQRAFLTKLGLTERPPLELPEIGRPLVPSESSWGETTTMTIAFGHGMAVNSVQLATAVSSLVNDGILVHPTILKRTEKQTKDMKKERVISSHTADQMRALMRLAVKEGTARRADVPGYLVGGKTGTADKIVGRNYDSNARMSSFIGIFPSQAPRYLVFALLDDPKGTAKTYGFATGGWTAAPAVGRVISQIGPLLNLAPVEPDVLAATEHQLLKPLGSKTLQSLNLKNEADDYASVESPYAE